MTATVKLTHSSPPHIRSYRVRMCMFVCIVVYVCVFVCLCLYVCVYVYIRIHMCVFVGGAYVYVCVCV